MPFGVPGRVGWESIAEMLNPEEWEGFLNFFRGGDAEYIPGRDPSYDLRVKTKKNAAEAFDRLGDDIIGAIVGAPEGIPVTQPQPAMPQRSLSSQEVQTALKSQPRASTIPTDPRSLGLLAPDPMRQRALESIAGREASEAERAAEEQAARDYLKQLSEARAQDEWVRSVGYEPDQNLSDPEKGILVEEMPADKLLRIRAQARAKGRRGDLRGGVPTEADFASAAKPTGGGLSYAPDSPEIQQRFAEREQWASQQPMRDAEYALRLAQERRDPAAAESATNILLGLRQQALAEKKQNAINTLLGSISDKSGKIDPDTYQKLGMLGQYVPSSMVGTGKDEAVNYFDKLIQEGSAAIAQLAPNAMLDRGIEARVGAERKGVQLAGQLRDMVARGQMSPDEAMMTFQQAMMMDQYVQGWLAQRMNPSGQVPTEGE